MNPNYTEFKFPQIKAHPWSRVFSKTVPQEAIDLLSCFLQYDPTKRISGEMGGGGGGLGYTASASWVRDARGVDEVQIRCCVGDTGSMSACWVREGVVVGITQQAHLG